MKPLSLAWLRLHSPTRELERHQLYLHLRIRLASASELLSKITPIVREPDCLCPRSADTHDHLSPIDSVSTLLAYMQRYKASLSAPLPLFLSCPLSVRLACSSVHTHELENRRSALGLHIWLQRSRESVLVLSGPKHQNFYVHNKYTEGSRIGTFRSGFLEPITIMKSIFILNTLIFPEIRHCARRCSYRILRFRHIRQEPFNFQTPGQRTTRPTTSGTVKLHNNTAGYCRGTGLA